jgi:hypothetical protein
MPIYLSVKEIVVLQTISKLRIPKVHNFLTKSKIFKLDAYFLN